MNLGSRFCCLLLLLLACTETTLQSSSSPHISSSPSPSTRSTPPTVITKPTTSSSKKIQTSSDGEKGVTCTPAGIPGKVEHLHIDHIQDNFTSVEVFFSCPNETERHGDIKYYILSYEAQREHNHNVTENPQGLNISAEPESNCNYSRVVPITAQVHYMFSVRAYNKYNGTVSEKNYTTLTGASGPVASLDVLSTTADSITIQWTRPSLPNGNILWYLINVTSDGKHERVINVTCDQPEGGGKPNCKETDTSNTESALVVNQDRNELYYYNIETLQSYTNYTIAISCVNINGTGVERNITFQTNMTVPGKVEHLHIEHIQDNFTSVEVFFSCPNETERHGDIKYYILSYEAQREHNHNVTENPQGLNISAEPESNCNYSRVVPITAQVDYRFSVRAYSKYNGTVSEKNYTTLTGASGPVASLDVLSTTADSISIQWTRPSLPNGNILWYLINVTSDGKHERVINVTCDQPEGGGKPNCKETDTSNTESAPVVNQDRNEQCDYNITGLESYTNYTIVISCVNINGTGVERNITFQTNMTVPGMVENLHIEHIQDNFTSVEVFFSCPNETERHGDIKYYILSYEAQRGHNHNVTENPQGLNISAEPESNCNYSRVVPITAQVHYMFSVRAYNKYNGTVSEKNYTTLTGASGPVASLDVLSTTADSISIQWTRPSLPNGNILWYLINVTSDGKHERVINVTCDQPEGGGKPNCKETDTSNTESAPVVNQDRNEQCDYNITGLESYTNYTIVISCVNINGTGVERNITFQTNMTVPGMVENLHIDHIQDNFTSVEVFFSCPNETERHGDIKYYILSYEAQRDHNHNVTENPQGLNISAEPESNCNYSRVVPITAQVDYRFSVRAYNKYNGTVSEKNYTTLTGASGPVASLDVLSTTADSISIQWTRPSLPNGNILWYLINVTSDGKHERVINVTCDQPEGGGKQNCNATDTSNTKSAPVVNQDRNELYYYNIETLQSYTNHTIAISCVNINGTGVERNITVQTNMTVPLPPNGFRALVISSSSVTLCWTPAHHQDGPTTYYITVGEETSMNSHTFQEKEYVTVSGFYNTSALIEGLRSYWKYTFNITAATPVGNSCVLSLEGNVRTNESAPGKVENLHIAQIPHTFTSVEVFFSCPKETERHGDIQYYILSYDAQGEYNHNVTENPQGLTISAEPESNCNYSRVVPVTAQVDYRFSVHAFNKYNGTVSEKNYTTLTGESGPVASLVVLNTTAYSITIQWTKPSLPNGNILGYLINVTSGDKPDRVINVTCDQSTEDRKHECKAVDTTNTSSAAVFNQDGNKQYDYNITALESYTDYTIVISCVNINGTGEERNTYVQTNMTVPSPPKDLQAFANRSSSVTLFWTPADHQDGPTTYYITVGEENSLNSLTFQEIECVTVTGFHNTSVLVEGLRSYWNYNFSITAATPDGNSSVVSLNRTVRTEESAPGKVENLRIAQIKDNFTSLEVIFSCPNETERHGDIKYYILSYDAQGDYNHSMIENNQGLNISAEPEPNCNYSRVVPVTPEVNYMFSVVAYDSYAGNETTEYHFAKDGQPGSVSDFTSTSTTNRSISLSWKPPRFSNGFILGYVLHVHTEDGVCLQAVHIVCTDCQSHGTFRVEDEICNISRNATIQRPETSPANFNVTSLLSFTNYTITVAAVNNFRIGINTSLAIRTDIDVPAMPGNLSVTVLNASAVEVTWTPPVHKSGPTDYTILVQPATGRQSSTFENMKNVTVNGYNSSERTIGDLLSSWRYKFSIIASTYKGGSSPMVSERYITTQESEPCEVQNLSVSSIPGNFTAVNLTWDCPIERERNGFIKNYTIQYSGPGALPTVYGHYEPEDPCNATHTAILPVRPEHNYTFNVSANAMYKGKTNQSNVFPARAGKPLTKTSSEIFISTAAQSKDVATDTSFTVSFDSTTLLDDTNGKMIEAGILVMKKNEKTSKRPENMTDWDTWKNWYKWKNSGYKGSYRPTPEHYLIHVRKRRSAPTGESLMSYSVGVDVKCDSEQDQFCNGPLEPETIYKVVAVSCTSAGCTSTDPFGNFKTELPARPENLSVTVLNASAVEVTWTPPVHKSGSTNFTILVQQATGRQSSTFENIENVTVNGHESSERTIGGLLSSWRYKFSITAKTHKVYSFPMVSGSYILTKESKPSEVTNLNVLPIPGNFTAVNLTWDCPNERERNGFIKNYTIQYSGPGAVPMVYGHYEPEDPCDDTHTAILPVRPENNYTFMVSANAMDRGKTKQSNVIHSPAGKPLIKTLTETFINTATQSKGVATDTSFTVSFDSMTLLDDTNGEILGAGILVMKGNEKSSKRPENMTDWDTWKNWYKWKNSGYKGSYRPTQEHYLTHTRKRRSASTGQGFISYSVGVDVNCDSEKDQFCNGPLEQNTMYKVVAVACTIAGCTSTEPFGNFRTEQLGADKNVTPWIAFGVTTAILLCVIVILVIYFKVVQPAKTLRSRGEGHALELAVRGEDGTGHREDTPYDEVACGSAGDNPNALANKYYENIDIRKQETYEQFTAQVNDDDKHLYDTMEVRL
ncbi:phosphatidylinositol phosphatase PTPRQ-like isoform X3 [Haliotis rufescens]|uniref:phosphatidylinositol phosphatase PTPRQ-like isoform X3 n=1 Tax=Haliotis rufescens TaxID=6454 RepID=UPI00201E8D43|nr:phosphatidylinositol phosphatase PTPRQ-like isoform X3 [Haliotis rufescens]